MPAPLVVGLETLLFDMVARAEIKKMMFTMTSRGLLPTSGRILNFTRMCYYVLFVLNLRELLH
jgi:hypothetical protein